MKPNRIFPADFAWGTATSAYQIEGAAQEDGRGTSIWDVFARTPGRVLNGDTGDLACDSYHRAEEDLGLLQGLGVKIYRFSVAWPRIIPDGDGEINPDGFRYYDQLVDGLIARGITPMLTLYHWDLPQALQEKGGWSARATAEAFERYARVVFDHFRGRVNHWLTINEPWCVSFLSHALGHHAPGMYDLQLALTVAHHVLLAHGRAVRAFREMEMPGGIGHAPNTEWFLPEREDSEADRAAAGRRNAFINDWFFEPVLKGTYPAVLLASYEAKGFRVPVEAGDMELISQPVDFVGVNYYTGGRVRHVDGLGLFELEETNTGWEKTDFHWNVYPEGFKQVLLDIRSRYGEVPLYITENGACYDEADEDVTADPKRIRYLERHLAALLEAIEAGVPVKGYMCWSLMDNFEWAFGYGKRFGLVHVDFATLRRTPKQSYHWYASVIANHGFARVQPDEYETRS